MPINQIEVNVILQKQLCKGAAFYILNLLVIDATPAYNHITSAIGGAIVVRAEHMFFAMLILRSTLACQPLRM